MIYGFIIGVVVGANLGLITFSVIAAGKRKR